MKENLINLILSNNNLASDRVLRVMLEKLYQSGVQDGWAEGFNDGVNFQNN